jgi:hypothetical protein
MTDDQLARRRERDFLLSFLRKGGRLLREDIGGVVGVRWGRAHRSGPPFDPQTCERLLEKGCVIDGLPHVLHPSLDAPENVFELYQLPPEQASMKPAASRPCA